MPGDPVDRAAHPLLGDPVVRQGRLQHLVSHEIPQNVGRYAVVGMALRTAVTVTVMDDLSRVVGPPVLVGEVIGDRVG